MPGYKSLPEEFNGLAAEQVRIAEVLQRIGAKEDAANLLEAALEVCAAASPELPGWLCGRLATVYRTLKRHDDEVRLLVRYRDSQRSEEARTRFDARLSKARAIAERKSRTETRMLTSVSTAVSRRPAHHSGMLLISEGDLSFASTMIPALRDALIGAAADGDGLMLDAVLLRFRNEFRALRAPLEQLVAALKYAWRTADPPTGVNEERWMAVYRDALTRSLALYFDDAGQS
jgi:hypothetical protein